MPADAPPTFIVCAGSGDAQHAIWADDYFRAFLNARGPLASLHPRVHAVVGSDRLSRPTDHTSASASGCSAAMPTNTGTYE